MKTQEFDRKFDAGEDISQLLDLSKAKGRERQQRSLGKRSSKPTLLNF